MTEQLKKINTKKLRSLFFWSFMIYLVFPCSSVGKECASSAGDLACIPGLRRSPGEANGNPLQYPCLENPMGGGTWWATVHGVAKSWTQHTNLW